MYKPLESIVYMMWLYAIMFHPHNIDKNRIWQYICKLKVANSEIFKFYHVIYKSTIFGPPSQKRLCSQALPKQLSFVDS